jgi:hypothetical protein
MLGRVWVTWGNWSPGQFGLRNTQLRLGGYNLDGLVLGLFGMVPRHVMYVCEELQIKPASNWTSRLHASTPPYTDNPHGAAPHWKHTTSVDCTLLSRNQVNTKPHPFTQLHYDLPQATLHPAAF